MKRPAEEAWVIAPSNGFNRIGGSGQREYGPEFGAEVVLPKQLLAASMARGANRDYLHLLRDNSETPLFAPPVATGEASLHRTAELLKLTEGAGAQIFATTFVRCPARECVRRAQPETLLGAVCAAAEGADRGGDAAGSCGERDGCGGVARRRGYGGVLCVDQPANAERSGGSTVPGLVQGPPEGHGDWARVAGEGGTTSNSRITMKQVLGMLA